MKLSHSLIEKRLRFGMRAGPPDGGIIVLPAGGPVALSGAMVAISATDLTGGLPYRLRALSSQSRTV